MSLFGETVTFSSGLFLFLALGLALSFEFVNGFHDTANAVATVIYTHSLRPAVAVVWSGCWNLIGVLTSSGAVAFGVLALLPVELVLNVGSGAGFAMVFALLISAILWNLGTWYLGLPASSSHTLVGAIMGVGLANSWLSGGREFGGGVDWAKASEIGSSLLISPVIGFTCAAGLLLLSKRFIHRKDLYSAPDKQKTPPLWIRSLLVLTCTGVSFAHGSNDGQKGMGLIMLILVGILPLSFAVDLGTDASSITGLASTTVAIAGQMERRSPEDPMTGAAASRELSAYLKTTGAVTDGVFAAAAVECREISAILTGKNSLREVSADGRRALRSDLFLTSEVLGKLIKQGKIEDPEELRAVAALKSHMDKFTKFIPVWVKVAVALALGLGTMIGWQRIVITVGEKIGKEHLTYAQGASAELVAMATILAADQMGLR